MTWRVVSRVAIQPGTACGAGDRELDGHGAELTDLKDRRGERVTQECQRRQVDLAPVGEPLPELDGGVTTGQAVDPPRPGRHPVVDSVEDAGGDVGHALRAGIDTRPGRRQGWGRAELEGASAGAAPIAREELGDVSVALPQCRLSGLDPATPPQRGRAELGRAGLGEAR